MGNRLISGKTRLCGVIGDPIEHTMSPAMHNAAFEKAGFDYLYLPFRVKKEELGKAIEGMKALGIRGLNVTIPHKVAVIPFLDELDPLAEKIGAVNTIVNDDGILRGFYNNQIKFWLSYPDQCGNNLCLNYVRFKRLSDETLCCDLYTQGAIIVNIPVLQNRKGEFIRMNRVEPNPCHWNLRHNVCCYRFWQDSPLYSRPCWGCPRHNNRLY